MAALKAVKGYCKMAYDKPAWDSKTYSYQWYYKSWYPGNSYPGKPGWDPTTGIQYFPEPRICEFPIPGQKSAGTTTGTTTGTTEALVGVGVGIILVVAVVVFAMWWRNGLPCCKRAKKKANRKGEAQVSPSASAGKGGQKKQTSVEMASPEPFRPSPASVEMAEPTSPSDFPPAASSNGKVQIQTAVAVHEGEIEV